MFLLTISGTVSDSLSNDCNVHFDRQTLMGAADVLHCFNVL